jgi:hypothetical protein|tara:strand:+ start:799 stop:1296 length:498 start_codon:yes stop_codon:yes gene_type:complete
METTQQKPKFEPQKVLNTAHLVTFESAEPFYSKENDYGKMSYGYNVVVNGVANVWFASEAINNLLKLKNIAQGEEISIEFKSGTNEKTGNPYKIWLLNGKSAQDLAQEAPHVTPERPSPTEGPGPAIAQPVEATPSSEPTDEEKLRLLWVQYKNNGGLSDEDIPF